jgi:aspartate/tyrosine/aromatic aminotransferase
MVAEFLACCHIPTAMNVVSQQCHSIGTVSISLTLLMVFNICYYNYLISILLYQHAISRYSMEIVVFSITSRTQVNI